jgi:hypothetical protein
MPSPNPRRVARRGVAALCALALSTLAAAPVAAQDLLVVPRITGPIVLDGRVDEAAWEAIAPLPAVMFGPRNGAQPSERTEFRLGYDDAHIYFSCRNYDSDPAGMRAPTLRRDAANMSNDWCVLQLDTFNDEETALAFGTTPAGVRTDVIWSNDGAGNNFTWNTFWDVAVHVDETGWFAEIRIPLSSLRFQDRDGTVVMGVSAWRNIARKNEVISFPAISDRWGGNGILKASQFHKASFAGIRSTRPVYVTPYVLGAGGRSWALDNAGVGFDRVDDRSFDIGGDLKYALASNLTLDLTVNTDFAQVEADDQQVNLTRFSLFFPEKRLFFQERGEIFAFGIGGSERLFHSRRIGLVPGGALPILGGARVVGRVGEWDVGLLDMQTGATSFSPSENLGVLRLRRRVLNPNSYVGGLVTTRFAAGGAGRNVLYAADGLIRVFGQDFLTLNLAQSADDAVAPAPFDAERALARAFWERRGVDGPAYSADVTRVGAAFDPGLGFLLRRDYTRAAVTAGYGWRPPRTSRLLLYGVELTGSGYRRNADGSTETAEMGASAGVQTRSGHNLSAGVTGTYEDLREGFALSDDAGVVAGEHTFVAGRVGFTAPNSWLLRGTASVQAGQFYDGRIASISVSPTWYASRHLELGGTLQLSSIDFPARDEQFSAQLARVRAQLMFSAQVLASAFVQYSSTSDRVSGNVRLRYNPGEGHDLYLVWNEQLLADPASFQPVRPRSESRVFVLKYSRTFTFARR